MNKYPGFISLAAVLALTACTGGDVSSRNAATPLTGAAQPARGVVIAQPLYTVQALRVSVPRTLKVSEANMFYPIADIVWRGDPRGDRHAQVEALMTAALTEGTRNMRSGPPVVVDVDLRRFHSLTEKARVTTGGVHAIRFVLTVRDARSGAVLDGPRMVNADFPAWGGKRTLEAEARGITEKVQIGERLKSVILRELSAPVSGTAPDLVSQAPLHPAEAMLQN
ncbi:DUF6778 family protein [Frigidibacter mobilis]|uniref:Putative lipoprotein n=1 Tax=Frigidibacter mobilis TaxID=1335048 RepID=A0A159Z3N3_9RHOB|nr:DUF6778 family protein [Frigidibacter mobilis]AMY69732.1 putative lipoprotein [Frigidibacter mobilis]